MPKHFVNTASIELESPEGNHLLFATENWHYGQPFLATAELLVINCCPILNEIL